MATRNVDDGILGAEESVTVPLHLSSERRRIKFKVTMHYPNDEKAESVEFSLPDPLEPTSKFHGLNFG